MSAETQLDPQTSTHDSTSAADNDAEEVVLRPHLSPRWALGWGHILAAALFAVLFLTFNHMPLFYSDVWGHVSYGEWMLEHRTLPSEDPFAPLAEGVPVVNSAWLSQVVLAGVERLAGPVGLSNVFALTVLATYLLFTWMGYVQTGRKGLAIAGAMLLLVLASSRVLIIRPEVFGVLCLAALLTLAAIFDRRQTNPVGAEESGDLSRLALAGGILGIAVLFALWANLHGSFVVGFGILGCHWLGRAIEVGWRERDGAAVFADRWFWRWLVLAEVAVAASLLNPHGMDLLLHVFTFGSHPNLAEILEWQPLQLGLPETMRVGASWLLLLLVMRHSRIQVRPTQILLLAAFTLAVIYRNRMVTWYAAVFVYALLPHMADIVGRLWPRGERGENMEIRNDFYGPSFRHTAGFVLVLWLAFAFSPISEPVLGGADKPPEQPFHEATPRGASEFLRENPPQGQTWNPQWWGDWLVWRGPEDLQPFMTTNTIHLAPPQVWTDYSLVADGELGWQRTLDKYRVTTVIIDKTRQARLNERIRGSASWEIVYEDDLAVILSRTPDEGDDESNGADDAT